MNPISLSLFVGTLLAAAVSSGLAVFVMWRQPILTPPRYGLRGRKRARARVAYQGVANLEPIMGWVAARIEPVMPRARQRALRHKISVAGEALGLAPAEFQALGLLAALAGAMIATACGARACHVLLVAMLAVLLPEVWLARSARRRLSLFRRRIPHVVDLLVLALGAGLDFTAALRQIVERAPDRESDVIEELGLVLEALQLGMTRRAALEQLAERAPCDEVRDLVAATIQAEAQGTALGIVLHAQAGASRQRRSTQAEETASKASTAMVLPLTLSFFALMILIAAPLLLDALDSAAQFAGEVT